MPSAIADVGLPGYEDTYPNWREWWLVARFREAYPHDIPTPGHLQAMAAIVEGLGSPWNISTNWDRCRWYHSAKGAIALNIRSDLATHDHDRLTKLVIAAHRNCVRVEVEAVAPRYLRVIFWPRLRDGAHGYDRHPTLSDLAKCLIEEAR